jgi:translation initiation factor 3 subunit I
MWNCETGECIQTFTHHGPVRGAAWAEGGQMFATISDPFVEHNAQISIYHLNQGGEDPVLEIDLPKENSKRINPTNICWMPLNETIMVCFDNGAIRLYDPSTGDEVDDFMAHEKKINRIYFNKDKTLFIRWENLKPDSFTWSMKKSLPVSRDILVPSMHWPLIPMDDPMPVALKTDM